MCLSFGVPEPRPITVAGKKQNQGIHTNYRVSHLFERIGTTRMAIFLRSPTRLVQGLLSATQINKVNKRTPQRHTEIKSPSSRGNSCKEKCQKYMQRRKVPGVVRIRKVSLKVHRMQGSRSTSLLRVSRLPRLSW